METLSKNFTAQSQGVCVKVATKYALRLYLTLKSKSGNLSLTTDTKAYHGAMQIGTKNVSKQATQAGCESYIDFLVTKPVYDAISKGDKSYNYKSTVALGDEKIELSGVFNTDKCR